MIAYKHLLICAVLCLSASAYAQPAQYTSTVNAAGGSNNISGNNYEWSVGEMAVVSTGTASNIIVTQGVLQPTQSAGSVAELSLSKNVKVYPVPTKSMVYAEYDFVTKGKLDYELTDITGKLVYQGHKEVPAGTGKISVNMEHLPNASYMLQVYFTPSSGERSAAAFKLEKIN